MAKQKFSEDKAKGKVKGRLGQVTRRSLELTPNFIPLIFSLFFFYFCPFLDVLPGYLKEYLTEEKQNVYMNFVRKKTRICRMKWAIPYLLQDLATPLLYDIIGIVSVHLYQEGLHYASTSHCKI